MQHKRDKKSEHRDIGFDHELNRDPYEWGRKDRQAAVELFETELTSAIARLISVKARMAGRNKGSRNELDQAELVSVELPVDIWEKLRASMRDGMRKGQGQRHPRTDRADAVRKLRIIFEARRRKQQLKRTEHLKADIAGDRAAEEAVKHAKDDGIDDPDFTVDRILDLMRDPLPLLKHVQT